MLGPPKLSIFHTVFAPTKNGRGWSVESRRGKGIDASIGRNQQKIQSTLYLCAKFFLAIGTLLLYWPTSHYGFIVADDYEYITQNPPVLKGLSWTGVDWAFWSMDAHNWHPLTWLSHMLDCSLYGLYPGGHHLTNVFFHTANTVLLFILLKRLTGKLWPSAFVAALFAWHPLHVQSVAWICERKDVLSTFFLLLTIDAYSRYVARPTRGRFLLALGLFSLGLMSKPMLVTLPCVLLLLDYWPFHRINTGEAMQWKQWTHLIVEKIPFFFLALIGCVLTFAAQSATGAVRHAEDFPLLVRLANPICSYGRYLAKAVWPGHMVIFYPMPPTPSWMLFALSLLVILGCTYLAFRWRDRFPWFGVGWLWFLGTLVPVIGIVQVGFQAMADRYTYIPYIGLFIIVAWGADYWIGKRPSIRPLALSAGAMALCTCIVITRNQMGYWHSNIEVFSHAVSLTPANLFSNGDLSYALAEANSRSKAMPPYEAILHIQESEDGPPVADDNEAIAKRDDETTRLYELLNYDPNNATLYNNLGMVLSVQNKADEAIAQFEKATQLDSKSPWAYFNEAVLLQERGRVREAAADYKKAIDLRPVWPEALDKLAYLLATCPENQERNPAEAVELATKANELTARTSPGYLHTLAIAYAEARLFSNAVGIEQVALQKAEQAGFQKSTRDFQHELALYQKGKAGSMDWQRPPGQLIVYTKNEVLPAFRKRKE